jgi:hypothetical protein
MHSWSTIRRVYGRMVRRPEGGPTGASEMGRAEPQFPPTFGTRPTPGIEPTNNLAERAIRFVVQDRHVTQGTRSERGRRWCERIWTATATCAQQGRSVFDYLHQTLLAHFAHQPTPSLMPAGP